MTNYHDFFQLGRNYLQQLKDTQAEPIKQAAAMLGTCMAENGIVQLCGLGHNHSFTMELFYRAGGLMPFHGFNTRDLLLRGYYSEEETQADDFYNRPELVEILWNLYNIQENDLFLLVSDLGNEGIIIDLARKAKRLGHKLIVVTSLNAAKEAECLHPQGKKLYEYADLVLDTLVPNPDVVFALDEKNRINQLSTITGNVLAQMLTAETYRWLKEHNKEALVLLSANIQGADRHNREISDRYLGRWNV